MNEQSIYVYYALVCSCIHLMLPFDLVLRRYFFKKTNRNPESILGVEFLVDFGLFFGTLIWLFTFLKFGQFISDDQVHNQFKEDPSDRSDLFYMMSIIST